MTSHRSVVFPDDSSSRGSGGCPAYIPEDRLRDLARILPYECWGFVRRACAHAYPILWNLVTWTLTMAYETDATCEARYGCRWIFCTGLRDRCGKLVYGIVEPNDPGHSQDWRLACWARQGEKRLAAFACHPFPPSFHDSEGEAFIPELPISVDYTHVVSARGYRWPGSYARLSVPERCDILRAAVEYAVQLAEADPAIAALFYYRGGISMLLPLYLDSRNRDRDPVPDLALVLTRHDDHYVAPTCLELDDAYMDARLLGHPKQPWLVAFRRERDDPKAA